MLSVNEDYNLKILDKKNFPESLLQIPSPPEKLYMLGELPKKDSLFLSIVGSRRATSYGKEVCKKIISGLQGYNIVIVSGFAMGIDTFAHENAISAGLKTVVFPGSGLGKNKIYPKINHHLISKILESGGCFLSEFEPDFVATPWAFPMRNRLMAGISRAILIVEAEERSGTLITARLALDYNKEVLAVPGSIFSSFSSGPNRLIREGAIPVFSAKEVLEVFGIEEKNNKNAETTKQQKLFADLSPEEDLVFKILKEPMSKDDLLRQMNFSTSKSNAILSLMEIKGLITENNGEIKICNF